MPTLRELLVVGAHFGHKKEHSHPAARRFVYTIKDGILVINIEKTLEYLEQALKFLQKTIEEGGVILFVGTKKQASDSVKETAQALGMPYISRRWLGGTLTNFATIKKSLFQLEQLEKKINDPSFEKLSKRERTHITEKKDKLTQVFEGILNLTRMPEALFAVDANHEDISIAEANRLGIPVVAVMDTNGNPDLVEYPIPVNDESKKVIEMIMAVIRDELKNVKPKVKEQTKETKIEQVPARPGKTEQSSQPKTEEPKTIEKPKREVKLKKTAAKKSTAKKVAKKK